MYVYIQDIASVLFGQGEGDPVSQIDSIFD